MEDYSKINLQITDANPFIGNALNPFRGICIGWSSDIGIGEYTLYRTEDGWMGYSEYMDNDEDKALLKELMKKFVEMIKVM